MIKVIQTIFKTFLLSLLVAGQVNFVYAQTASILPNAKTVFLDNNGKPLVGGKVQFYIPGTTTAKTTWQDSGETIPNTNPVILDSAGRAIILGDGSYRQQVFDRNNNLIWDQATSSTGSGGGGATATVGDGDAVGTVKPWAGLVAPNQYVFTYGQQLARTSFPELFAAITTNQNISCTLGSPTLTGLSDTTQIPVGSPIESNCVNAGATVISTTISTVTSSTNAIVSTSTSARFFPFGNGNASSTFTLPDYRGKTLVGNCIMGGIACTNLTATYYGSNPSGQGVNGGNQSITLNNNNLPPYTPKGGNAASSVSFSIGTPSLVAQGTGFAGQTTAGSGVSFYSSGQYSGATATAAGQSFTGTAQGGTDTPFSIIQPSSTVNYIIKTTPDSNPNSFFGVASIGGLEGIITCGTGITCAGNVISAVSSIPNVNVNPPLVISSNVISCPTCITGANAVITCGADPTGAIDSTSAINTCLTNNPAVYLPAGTYKISSTLTMVQTFQKLTGAGRGITILMDDAASGAIITFGGNSSVEIGNLTVDRSVVPDSTGHGIQQTNVINQGLIYNIEARDQFNGFALTGIAYGFMSSIVSDDNYSNGILFEGIASAPAIQWNMDNILSQQNNADGIFVASDTNTNMVLGEPWRNITTFANTGHGIHIQGGSGYFITDINISSAFLGGDGASEIYLDTYSPNGGVQTLISNIQIEDTGAIMTGRANATAATHVGHGIEITANNRAVNLTGISANGVSQDGIISAAALTAITNATIVASGTSSSGSNLNGIEITAGSAIITNVATGNDASSFQQNGIVLGSASTKNIVTGNNVSYESGNVIAGIADNSSTPTTESIFNNVGSTIQRLAGNNIVATSNGPGTNGQLPIGVTGSPSAWANVSGDATLSSAGALTLAPVNSNTGTFGSATQCVTITSNAKGLTTALAAAACAPPIGSITGLGTGIATALAKAPNTTGGFALEQSGTINYFPKWSNATGGLASTSRLFDDGTTIEAGSTPTACSAAGFEFALCDTGNSVFRFSIGISGTPQAFQFTQSNPDSFLLNSQAGHLFFGTNNVANHMNLDSIGNLTLPSGNLILASGTPTIASGACGTGTNGVITSGTNQAGLVTIGAVATTTCTVSFSTTIIAPAACLISPANAAAAATATTLARVSSIGTTSWTITGLALANAAYYYHCI